MKRSDLRKIIDPYLRDRGQVLATYTWFVSDADLGDLGYIKISSQTERIWWCVEKRTEEVESYCTSLRISRFDGDGNVVDTIHEHCGWRLLATLEGT